ncbi:AraC family transcriptional regulator [uncultured Campylobacter sp.]|uniref:helix-turn-helix domain-containing protein n=1 Tax=uncultured Campylobacter sp. TaxID=218934 RepID=UPI002621A3A7|nr:response regulator transcription factor [uncultured Campylobacter sp.]
MYVFPDDLSGIKNVSLFKRNNFVFAKYIQEKSGFFQKVKTNMHCFVLVKNGSKIVHSQNGDYELKTGDALFLKADKHIFSNIKTHKRVYEAILLFFDNNILLNFAKSHKDKLEQCEAKFDIFKIERNDFLNSIINSFEIYIDNFLNDILLLHKIEELFLYVLLRNKLVFSSFLMDIVREFEMDLNTIFTCCDSSFATVADMANSVNMDNATFTRKFRTIFDKSPKNWLDDKRFEKALFLLEYTPKNINEICSDCGFSSVSWFIERFKKRFNTTPKQYQKSKNLYFLA